MENTKIESADHKFSSWEQFQYDNGLSDDEMIEQHGFIARDIRGPAPSTVGIMKSPTPEKIKEARKTAGHTQDEAAALLHTTQRTWSQWERGERAMHPAFFELYQIKSRSEK